MSAEILDGKIRAQQIGDSLKGQVEKLRKQTGQVPTLVNIIIGNDSGACVYAKSQRSVAEHIGIDYELVTLPEDISQEKLNIFIERLNDTAGVNGIMLHKPVPSHIDYGVAANHVDIAKDIEGINVANIGKMILGETKIIPCTPASVMELIKSTGVDLKGKEVVIVGHSRIVGKPLSLLLLEANATVTICHIATSEAGHLIEHVSRADILVVAIGKAFLVKGSWIKPGAIVIDVGINRVGGKIVGDVEFDEAVQVASYITPVPGGVGPVIVMMLMKNGIEAFKAQMQKK